MGRGGHAAATLASGRLKRLVVFDVDGTLLISKGREIVTSANGLRACIHPLVEPFCSGAIPDGCSSNFAYSGEEDLNGDEYNLLRDATLIPPIAERIKELCALPADECAVAILTARGHNPKWLAAALTSKLQLKRPIEPSLVFTVYSNCFEREEGLTRRALGRTEERKAYALGKLIELAQPSHVEFFDDMAPNRDAAIRYMSREHDTIQFTSHDVPVSMVKAALSIEGIDIRELTHFQCRDEMGTGYNTLVQALLQTEVAKEFGLREYERPLRSEGKMPP